MDLNKQTNAKICEHCEMEFCSVSSKNDHLKRVHNKPVENKTTPRILCPLCSEGETFLSHRLVKHLKYIHDIVVKVSTLNFINIKEFEI
ncbi:unnamed protein product [Brassicogethes aeneus]|uniref:C2H2-type domain-containing protein n=2 Tax=Brassicogethes aeneus TaxID=1431903 RepID=A0A9P0BEY2_BRAAE|nr:unnamed protein product [Brassicogethes aeneus]